MQDFLKQFESITRNFTKLNYEITQEVLVEVANEMARRLSNATHTKGTGTFAGSWKIKEYKNVKYVYNSAGTKGQDKGIPLSNLAEYSDRGPVAFILETWDRNKDEILRLFVQKMEQRLKNQ